MSASQHDPSQASSEDNLDDGLGGELTQDEIDDLAHRETFSNNFGSQLLPVPAGASKAVVVSWLNKQVPTNEFGLPTFFYRSDYLPGHESLTQNDADAAVVVLNYDEGYPTFDNGKIFWNQLPHETFGDYLTFQRYLDQAEELGLRQLQILSMDQNISLERITEMHAEYMWSLRARAFDLFQVAADRKRRELRVRSTEDKHFKIASGLIDRLKDVFEKEDFFANLDAKGAIEILRMLANLQRISMGLSQNGNMGNQPIDPMAGASGNDLMRQITKGINNDSDSLGIDANLAALMNDPNFTLEAQRLIFTVRQGADIASGRALASPGGKVAQMIDRDQGEGIETSID